MKSELSAVGVLSLKNTHWKPEYVGSLAKEQQNLNLMWICDA